MDNNIFYKYDEQRGQAGYKSAIVVKKQNEAKYQMLIASETVPAPFGTQDSFDFDLVNSPVKGKVVGKVSLDDKEVEFLATRDNFYRMEQYKDLVLDFMYVTPDFVAYKFIGTIKARPNDASADVLKATYTITPMSADDTPILDCRDMLQETVFFADVVPADIGEVNSTGSTITLHATETGATYTCEVYDFVNGVKGSAVSTNIEGTFGSNGNANILTLKQKTGATTGTHYALAFVTVSKTGYASWTTTVAVSTTKA